MRRLTHKQSAKRRRDIATFVREGGSHQEAADLYKVTPSTVHNACEEHGVETKRERMARVREEIASFVESGGTKREAAEKFQVAMITVYSACSGLGLKRATWEMPESSYTILSRLINTTDTMQEIAASCGVTQPTVFQIAKKARNAGISLHPERRVNKKRKPT